MALFGINYVRIKGDRRRVLGWLLLLLLLLFLILCPAKSPGPFFYKKFPAAGAAGDSYSCMTMVTFLLPYLPAKP